MRNKHKTLSSAGDDPLSLYVLTTATTGAASMLTEGMILHPAFPVNVSNFFKIFKLKLNHIYKYSPHYKKFY